MNITPDHIPGFPEISKPIPGLNQGLTLWNPGIGNTRRHYKLQELN